jgi:FtsH-binding integral membrane protein
MQTYYSQDSFAVQRAATLSRVMGLLAIASAFTAAGALVGLPLGRAGFFIGLVGAIACLIALGFVKDRTPLNLVLLYAFAVLEGIFLGQVLETYLRAGLSRIVLDAAAVTAGVSLVAGAYGYTTKRDLTALGSVLFIGLLAVIGASLLGLFLHLSALYTAVAAAAALVFTGFLVFDLNRIAKAGQVDTGDAVLLAVSVYVDILNLFLALLSLLSAVRGDHR